jgi:hypothetical protein
LLDENRSIAAARVAEMVLKKAGRSALRPLVPQQERVNHSVLFADLHRVKFKEVHDAMALKVCSPVEAAAKSPAAATGVKSNLLSAIFD